MAKETNHRRKCKVAKVAEELDFDKLAKELKRNNKFKPKYDSNKNKNNGKNYISIIIFGKKGIYYPFISIEFENIEII